MLSSLSRLSSHEVDGVDKKKLGMLLKEIGQIFVKSDIKKDGLNINSFYKDTRLLSQINTKTYLEGRNQLLLQFLTGSINWDYRKQDNSVVLYSLAVVVECILSSS